MLPALLMCGSCTNDSEVYESYEQTQSVNTDLSATVPSVQSRVGLDRGGNFYWSASDELAIQKNKEFNGFYKFKLVKGAGEFNATFKCPDFNGAPESLIGNYILYPYSTENGRTHKINPKAGTIDYLFPKTYSYKQPDADLFTKVQGEGYSFNIPMWGVVSPSYDLDLQFLGGVFCVVVKDVPTTAKRQVFTLTTPNNKIAGSVKYKMAGTDKLALVSDLSKANQYTNHVSIEYTNRSYRIVNGQRMQNNDCVFYVPVPEGDYKDIVINVNGEEFNVNRRYIMLRGTAEVIVLQHKANDNEKFYEFQDDALKAYAQKNVDMNKDGKFSLTELKKVTEVSLAGPTITDETITELSVFPNLTSVKLNAIHVNVIDLTKVKNLSNLSINSNCYVEAIRLHNLLGLKELNISSLPVKELYVDGCTNLESLKCINNDLAEVLSVKGCTSLKVLDCANSNLLNLELNSCKALVELNCQYNRLRTLDLSQNMFLKKLDCTHNPCATVNSDQVTRKIKVWYDFSKTTYAAGRLNFNPSPKFIGRLATLDAPYFK